MAIRRARSTHRLLIEGSIGKNSAAYPKRSAILSRAIFLAAGPDERDVMDLFTANPYLLQPSDFAGSSWSLRAHVHLFWKDPHPSAVD